MTAVLGAGIASVCLAPASRLGARCAFAGVLGDDEDSRYVLDRLAADGIDVSPRVVRAGASRAAGSWICVPMPESRAHVAIPLTSVFGSG